MIPDTALKVALPPGRRWQALVRRSDFLRLTASGMRRVTPGFILQAAPRGDHPTPQLRIGFTASRKVGNAVARNRAKRRLRSLADLVMADLPTTFDYVLVARPDVLTRNFAQMAGELHHAVKKLTSHPRAATP